MARLGELLVAARLLDREQIDRALQAQVLWGGRLGTNLIELGMLDLDGISRALGRQHGVPAALARHFERADRELQARLSAELARRWSVVPLLHVGPKKDKIAIAVLDPLPAEAIAELADELACAPGSILVSVAAELRVRYHLERVYGIARPTRFLRARGKTITPFPPFENVPVPVDSDAELAVPIAIDDRAHPTGRASADPPVAAPPPGVPAVAVEPGPPPEPVLPPDPPLALAAADDIAALIEEAIAQVTACEPTQPVGRDRRTYLRTLADDGPATAGPTPVPAPAFGGGGSNAASLARIALKRVPAPQLAAAATRPPPATFREATRAIRRAHDRDQVAELVIDTLERFVPSCVAAILLVVRGGVATSWKQFSRAGGTAAELAVPLDQPGLVPAVIERNATLRRGVAELGSIDEKLMRSIGELRGDLAVVPIAVADRVLCTIAAAVEPEAPIDAVESVAAAAAAAFARLIRDASR